MNRKPSLGLELLGLFVLALLVVAGFYLDFRWKKFIVKSAIREVQTEAQKGSDHARFEPQAQ